MNRITIDSPSSTEAGAPSLLRDRAILAILMGGLLMRLALAFGLHWHFSDANPPHLWPGTDEATFYQYGLNASHLLAEVGCRAFLDAPPSSQYFNWLHFKYTGLALYLFGGSPLALRILSILFTTAGLALLIDTLGRPLSRRGRILMSALVLFLPSGALWSALAIKEGVVTLLTGALCWGIARFWRHSTPWPALAWSAGVCLVLGGFRIWAGVGFFLIAGSVLLFLHPGRPRAFRLALALVLVAAALWALPPVRLLINRNLLAGAIPASDGGIRPKLNIIHNARVLDDQTYPAPLKILMAAVLPLPGQGSGTVLSRAGGWENLVFLGTFLLAVRGVRRRLEPIEWIWIGIAAVTLAVAVLVGTNTGTIYRMKTGALPFIAYFAACAPGWDRRRSGVDRTHRI